MNYDDACFAETNEVGTGVVVRNKLGLVMVSLSEKIPMSLTVEVLEAMAARRAMIFTEELGLPRAIFEGDSELVVKALLGDYSNWSCIGHMVKDCMVFSKLARSLMSGNEVVHALIKRARKFFPLSTWMEPVPPNIFYLVYVDVIA